MFKESLAPQLLLRFSLFLGQSSFCCVASVNGYSSLVFCVEFVYVLVGVDLG